MVEKNKVLQFSLCLTILTTLITTIWSESGTRNENGKVVMCYWGTWAYYKRAEQSFGDEFFEEGKFTNEDIDPLLCTHLIYSFAGLHIESTEINSLDPELDLEVGDFEPHPENPGNFAGQHGILKKAVLLKAGNPDLKVLIAIGGWGQESRRFSDMARSLNKRRIFIDSIIAFIRKHNLDGVDMDWEYPARRGGFVEDKQNFPIFLQELKGKLNETEQALGRPLVLTSAFGCGKEVIDAAYDVPEISKYIDYFNLMLYDFKVYDGSSSETKKIGHQSPLFPKSTESERDRMLTSQWAVDYFIELGAPPEKLVLGVGTYGRTYTMTSRSAHNFYDVAAGPGPIFAFTQTEGVMSYYEICLDLRRNPSQWEFRFDDDYKVPYAFNDVKWIGYDDEISAQEKVDFAMERGLAGMMVWSIDQDDFKNYCGGWIKFPILSALNDRLEWHRMKQIDKNS